MTLLDLIDAPHVSLNAQLAAFFRERPTQWIDGRELGKVGGCYAYRTRISNLRRQPFNMTIENRQRKGDGFTISEYRYQP